MKEFWNQRYNVEDYTYGEHPNKFISSELQNLKPGKILFPADGEGRNSVFAAKNNWKVFAFDYSEKAREKALKLAQKNQVEIDYKTSEFEDYKSEDESFDVIALSFFHMPPDKRTAYHKKLIELLKPGGKIILQGFHKKQINYNTGGPKNVEMLFNKEELHQDFSDLKTIFIDSKIEQLDEGDFHSGEAFVINYVGEKESISR
jgi:2-polyprenyl-3-methyl-5-hydroxy-6-metoxy-1,4-benzoquinol methylase